MVMVRKAVWGDLGWIAGAHAAMHANLSHLDEDYYQLKDGSLRPIWEFYSGTLSCPEKLVVVVDIDFGPAGFAYAFIESRPPTMVLSAVGCLEALFVVPEHRGKDLGRCLIRAVLDWFSNQSVTSVECTVDVKNPLALRLLQDMGFRTFQHRVRICF